MGQLLANAPEYLVDSGVGYAVATRELGNAQPLRVERNKLGVSVRFWGGMGD